MPTIKLIVTGDMEKSTLHESLKKTFPASKNEQAVIWDTPHKLNGTTNERLSVLAITDKPSSSMMKLARAMIAEAIRGKNGQPADLVIVIDDVELANLQQEYLIAEHFKAAVSLAISERSYNPDKEREVRTQIRQKCSFHCLKPMVEAYLFADRAALGIAGVSPTIQPLLSHATDVEAFETNDPDQTWLNKCRDKNAINHANNKDWWQEEYHAKHYLEHLIKAEYIETKAGKDALLALNWPTVTKTNTDAPIISALFADLADWFVIDNPLKSSPSAVFWPSKQIPPNNLLLRNI